METETAMCIPLTCRGLQVLGFPFKDKIYLCVHQLAIELWKAFDTPRVSVQRKIIDLGIKLVSSDRNMIKVLRAAGIIDNFRATMILIRDAEILCDALEHSRKKRGLVKHALQSKHKPGERETRREEQRAKKFTEKMESLYNLSALQSQAINSVVLTNALAASRPQTVIHGDECSSSGNSHSFPISKELQLVFDILMVAEDPSLLGGKETIIEQSISNAIKPRTSMLQNSTPIDLESIGGTKALSNHNHPTVEEDIYKPLSSPSAEFSEPEEIHSTSSISSRSRHQSSSHTPEPFLYLIESSESEEEPKEEFKRQRVVQRMEKAPGKPLPASNKRLVATKLRLFAQTTSPRTAAIEQSAPSNEPSSNHSTSSPLTTTNNSVSPSQIINSQIMKRKRGRPPKIKQPRVTALSSFATKKRAISRSPTPLDDTNAQITQSKRIDKLQSECRDALKLIAEKLGQEVSTTDTESVSTSGLQADMNSKMTHTSTQTNMADINNVDTPSTYITEDDIVSVASTCISTNSNSGQRSTRLSKRNKVAPKEKPSSFRFDDLFSYYPPKLVVRDGDLVPENSLSVKHLDRMAISNLPESHPFLHWNLGKPVSGSKVSDSGKIGRKRKMVS